MDFAASRDNEPYGLKVEDKIEDKIGTRQRSSAVVAGGRRSSAVDGNDEEPVVIIEGSQLSEEDRRLAQMGYVQVNSAST